MENSSSSSSQMDDSEDEREFDYEDDLDEEEEVDDDDDDDEEIPDEDDVEDESGAELLPRARIYDLEATLHGVMNNMRLLHGPQSLVDEEHSDMATRIFRVEGDEHFDAGDLVDSLFDADAVISTADYNNSWDIAMAAGQQQEAGRALYLPSQLAHAAHPPPTAASMPPPGPADWMHPLLRRMPAYQGGTQPLPSYSAQPLDAHAHARAHRAGPADAHAPGAGMGGAGAELGASAAERSRLFSSVLDALEAGPGRAGPAPGAPVPPAAAAVAGPVAADLAARPAAGAAGSAARAADASLLAAPEGGDEEALAFGREGGAGALGAADPAGTRDGGDVVAWARVLASTRGASARPFEMPPSLLTRSRLLERAVRGLTFHDSGANRDVMWGFSQAAGAAGSAFDPGMSRRTERWQEERVRSPSSGFSILLGNTSNPTRNERRVETDGLFVPGHSASRAESRRHGGRPRNSPVDSPHAAGQQALRNEFSSQLGRTLGAVRSAQNVVDTRRAQFEGLRAERELEEKEKEEEDAAKAQAAEEDLPDAGGQSPAGEAVAGPTSAAAEEDGDAKDSAAEEQVEGPDGDTGGGENDDGVPAASGEDLGPAPFAQIVEERAASAGVSLQAPANEDPDVVAAAVASTGIDPTFLAALPDEMRTEVLTQHFAQVSTSRAEDEGDMRSMSFLNQEFLIALPPALRADVLAQEADYRSRAGGVSAEPQNAAEDSAGRDHDGGDGAGATVNSEEFATMLATVDRELREEILLTSGESLIAQLPEHLLSEARALRTREAARRGGDGQMPWQNQLGAVVDIGQRMPGSDRPFGQNSSADRNRRSSPSPDPRESAALVARRMESKWTFLPSEARWIRVVPKFEHEAPPVCKDDSLTILAGLLRLQSSQYGKSLLHGALSVLCKQRLPRRQLLVLLFANLPIESSACSFPAQSGTAPSASPPAFASASDAVVIRRTLEVLTNLCKHERLAAEDLVAIPCAVDNAAGLPGLFPATGDDSCSPASALVRLLAHPLFTRSSMHQEQLLSLLYIAFCAIPPAEAGEGDDVEPESSENSGQGDVMSTGSRSVDQGGPSNVNVSESEDQHLKSGDRSKDEKQAKSTVTVPVQFRVPRLRDGDLRCLADVLLQEGVSEKTYDRVTTVLGQLGLLPSNKTRALSALSEAALALGRSVAESFKAFVSSLSSDITCRDRAATAVQTFSMAASADELKLLRVTKAISTLIKADAAKGNSAENDGESGPDRQYLFGLKELWHALGLVLDTVRDQEAPGGQISRASSRASQVEGADRLRPRGGLRELEGALPAGGVVGHDEDDDSGEGMHSGGHAGAESHSLTPALARLNPVIESFFVYHGALPAPPQHGLVPESPGRILGRDEARATSKRSSSSITLSPEVGLAANELELFIKRHRVAVNSILRVSPQLLEGSYAPALRHAHMIDFDNKKSYFRNLIRKRGADSHPGTLRLNVRRNQVFVDSYHQLRSHTANEMRGRLHVQFNGEEGIDAGGVTREWYIILSRQIFDPNYALFSRSAAKSATYQPNKSSAVNHVHLDYFRFVGRIFGKAIYDGQLLDAYFTRSFYKHILGIKPTYHDIEAEDPDYYKSLRWVLENDITGVLDYTFSSEYEEFGRQMVIDLKPDGRNIPVTEENKEEYVRLVTEVKLTRAIEKQIAAFKEGFHELIPSEDCRIFNEVELELLTSGLPDIDVSDLKANVEYIGFSAGSAQICWFWEAVGQMGQEDLARLVMFVTGTSKVPLEGFSALQGMNGPQKFQIHRASGEDKARLPSAHTCFNQLDLPEYENGEVLQERLLRAIRETVGFGFS